MYLLVLLTFSSFCFSVSVEVLYEKCIFSRFFQEFMLCRAEERDPRKCINEGKAVTGCSLDFFRGVKKSCAQEFTQFAHCLDKSSADYSFEP